MGLVFAGDYRGTSATRGILEDMPTPFGSGSALIDPLTILERAAIHERMRVADFGCGSLGHIVFPAAHRVGPKGQVYAVDILRDALTLIERRAKTMGLKNVTTVWSDIDRYHATRIPEAALDGALLVNNLFSSKDRTALAKEMARLTKYRGRAVIVDWKPGRTPIGPAPSARVSPDDARQMMDIPEFRFIESFAAGPHHYGLVFERTDAPHHV